MWYLPDIASVVNTTSNTMSYLPDIELRRRIRYRRFTYDIVYDVVAPHQVDTTSYSTSYSRLTQCQVDTTY